MRVKQTNYPDESETNFSDSSIESNSTNLTRNTNDLSRRNSKVEIHSLIKQAVSRELFLGEYTEKRYVELLNTYRDIIVIDHTEQEIIQSLKNVRKIASTYYETKKWIGITDDEDANFYLWVKLEKLTLGRYWFKIQSIHIEEKEIILQLKAVRSFGSSETVSSFSAPNFDINEIINKENIWELLKFGFILFMTIITCFINAVPLIADWVLKFMREVSYLVHSLTPLILGIYELIAKCIGGLYWMIIMLFKSPNQMPYPPRNVNRPRIMY